MRGIAAYTLGEWGAVQASVYLDAPQEGCERLGESPMMGRSCEEVRPGVRRLDIRRHVVFYRVEAEEIVVVRVLHQRMLAKLHDLSQR